MSSLVSLWFGLIPTDYISIDNYISWLGIIERENNSIPVTGFNRYYAIVDTALYFIGILFSYIFTCICQVAIFIVHILLVDISTIAHNKSKTLSRNKGIEQACHIITQSIQNCSVPEPLILCLYIALSTWAGL